jgi:signal transduction histidine kinase
MPASSRLQSNDMFAQELDLPRARLGVAAAHVLVVEDEHLVALDIQLRLTRMGHDAVVAYSGEEAIETATASHFDLVLMDIKLDGSIDGIETARTIRRGYEVPIIYLTAYADNQTLDRARVTEPYGYLLKPFQERELKAAIEMALQKHGSDMRRLEQQRLHRFLADATGRMAASLEYRSVALGAAELLVPRYADWCTIHLKETNDSIPPYTHTRPNGHGETPINGHSAHLIGKVLRTARSEIVTQISEMTTLRDALGPDHLDVLRGIGPRSLVCVPLLARDQVLGALVLVSGRGRPSYTSEDLLFAEDFGHRLGVALDNALLYRKAERAIRMRDDVLAIVSHDLRTPLATVLMQAESLAEMPDLRKLGDAIVRSVQRMNRLIGDLLDASSVNAGQLSLNMGMHHVSEILVEATEMFRTQAEACGVELLEQVPRDPLGVTCDRDRMVQVLSNLIGNALKFTARGGKVVVSATRTEDGILFEVSDTGRGIEQEHVPHLFDRFWRAESKQNGGSGLGLFIARGIVAAHGGGLRVDTELGRGSRFYFTLPEARE